MPKNSSLRTAIALISAALHSPAQQVPLKEFEVATIRPNPSNENGKQSVGPAGLTFRSSTLLDLISTAYGVKDFQVSAPSWLSTERYDVSAKSSEPHSATDLSSMLRPLLAKRFQLLIHWETKNLPVYGLTAGKALGRIHPSAATAPDSHFSFEGGGIHFRNMTMSAFAEYLSHFRAAGRPVLDRTGLTGGYDFSLELFERTDMSIADMKRAMVDAGDGASILAAVQQQLGLKLENQRAPYRIVVVDRVDRIPTGN